MFLFNLKTMSKKLLIVIISSVIFLTACTNAAPKKTQQNNSNSNQQNMANDKFNKYSKAPEVLPAEQLKDKKSVMVTDKGTIEIKLFGDEAPLTVSNHIFLVNEKFYDGLIFHRREERFVIQGGDPLGTGYGGPGYQFEDEPVMRKYTRGIVAMANSGADTNGSQFFIMLADVPLPPNYTIFGEVIKGIEVIDQIKIGDNIISVKIENL